MNQESFKITDVIFVLRTAEHVPIGSPRSELVLCLSATMSGSIWTQTTSGNGMRFEQ